MYQTSAAYNEMIGRETRTFLARITFDDESVIDNGIRQATIVSGSCGSEMFTVGAAFSGYANLTIIDPEIDLTDQEFLLEIGLVLDDESVEYVPKGIYSASVADISRTKHSVTLTAWDRLARAGSQVYTPTVIYPCTAGDVLDDITNQTGLVFDLTAYPGIRDLEGFSAPEGTLISAVIGSIAGQKGGFAYADHNGNVVLAPYGEVPVRRINANQCLDEIILSDIVVSMDAGGEITQYEYYPGIVRFMGDPRLEPIDMIEIEDSERIIRQIPCMNIVLTYDGGTTTTIQAPAQKQTNVNWGPIWNQINRTREIAEAAVMETVREYTVTDTMDEPEESAVWTREPPTRAEGQYIWERTVTTYGNGISETGDPVMITGNAGAAGEDAVLLRVDSSNGFIFKNNTVNTILSVTIFKGSQVITDADTMRSIFGAGSYIQWSWKRIDDERYGVISADDSRIYDGGFKFRLSPEDVDTKVTFQCTLMI